MSENANEIDIDTDDSGSRQERLVKRDPDKMKEAAAYLTEYMRTYDQQLGYENYSEATFIDDVLYGLGVALDPKQHRFAQGFDAFKKKLANHLDV
jgi:hypothetical protein